MACREIIGHGSVWEKDLIYHDLVGFFRWKLNICQAGRNLTHTLEIIQGDEDVFYDGSYSIQTHTRIHVEDFPGCNTPGLIGKLITIACVATAAGQNSNVSLGVTGTLGSGPNGTTIGGGIGINYSPGYSGQKLEWVIRIQACPTERQCPSIQVVRNTCSVSDSEYMWGDRLTKDAGDNESHDVKEHSPQIGIGGCGVSVDPMAESSLPIDPDYRTELVSVDTAQPLR